MIVQRCLAKQQEQEQEQEEQQHQQQQHKQQQQDQGRTLGQFSTFPITSSTFETEIQYLLSTELTTSACPFFSVIYSSSTGLPVVGL